VELWRYPEIKPAGIRSVRLFSFLLTKGDVNID